MTADGRFVAFGDGFPELTSQNMPWVIRDMVTGNFTPIGDVPGSEGVAPSKAAGVTAAPLTFGTAEALGFSPDGSRLLLGRNTVGFISGALVFVRGALSDFDVARSVIARRFGGTGSASFPILRPTWSPDGNTITFTGTLTAVCSLDASGVGRALYDRATGRVTELADVTFNQASSSTDGRLTLYAVSCAPPALGVYLLDRAYGTPLPMPDPVRAGWVDAAGTMTIFTSAEATILPGGADTNGVHDVFAVDLTSRLDRDADGLDDRWEIAMGLDYTSSAGDNGAAGDPDGDGQTNLQEQTARSHPRGGSRQLLAEGADNAFFKSRLAIANPGATDATAVVRFDGDDGTSVTRNVLVAGGARRTIFADEVTGRTPSFATVVESSAPLVAERTMSWDHREYGAHAERATPAPSTTWFLAEGATGSFSLFYLLQNPGDTAATATIRYLRPAPLPPIERSYALPPHSRTTLPVNVQAPELAQTDVSAAIVATQPILVERAMYRSVEGQPFAAGHDSAGVTSAATSWFLAEGATGPFFDLFILLANPNATDADVQIRYLLPDGTALEKTYTVEAESRRTIYVDVESIPGHEQALNNVSVSCAIASTNGVPIVVERSMWWPGLEVTTTRYWAEAHNSPGTTATATRWVVADGMAGDNRGTQTYLLIANTSATTGRVRITELVDTPTGPIPSSRLTTSRDLPPNSRTTVLLNELLPSGTFGVIVESIDTAPLAQLVVERAMYWNSGGEVWAAGTNLLGTPVP